MNSRQLSADCTVDDLVIVTARAPDRHQVGSRAPSSVPQVREQGIRTTSDEKPHSKCLVPGTLLTMKILIALAVVGIIAGIVYKVLTTEVPIDES